MKYRKIFCLLAVMVALIFSLTGCLAEAVYLGVKTIDMGVQAASSNNKETKDVATEKEELVEQLVFKNTWVNIEKTGVSVKLLAFDIKKTDFITETEYTLDMDKYLAMSKDQKKIHIREYFKARTGLDLDPTLEPETAEKSPAPSSPPNIPLPGFAPAPRPR